MCSCPCRNFKYCTNLVGQLHIACVMPRFIFKIMIWNIFKNVFLGLFGVAVIAMGFTITSHFDKALKEDNFLLAYMSITWTAYIVCKAYSEYHRSKNGA